MTDEIPFPQTERVALGDDVLSQSLLDGGGERVEAARRGLVASAEGDGIVHFQVHSPRKPVRELVDAFSELRVGGSVDDTAWRLVVKLQNHDSVLLQLPREEILRQVVSESRRELLGHRVQDGKNTIGDVQCGKGALVPDRAEQS